MIERLMKEEKDEVSETNNNTKQNIKQQRKNLKSEQQQQ